VARETKPTNGPDPDPRIKAGLAVLSKANVAVLAAAAPLVLFENLELSKLAEAIKTHRIKFDKDHTYTGQMTQTQYDYITSKVNMATLEALRLAVFAVVGRVFDQIYATLKDLNEAWGKPPTAPGMYQGNGNGIPMPADCCFYDGAAHYGLSSDDCTQMQGRWLKGCVGVPPPLGPAKEPAHPGSR
jgi:hypothetical protein